MRTHILIISYARDIPYLEYCLRSIRKFATGFDGVTVVVPSQERFLFNRLTDEFGCILQDYPQHDDPRLRQIEHQGQKCRADRWIPDRRLNKPVQLIAHLDSDCIFTEPVTPDDYLTNGKPQLLIHPYDPARADYHWKAPTESALKLEVHYETMRRHPAVHFPAMYAIARDFLSSQHGINSNKRTDDFMKYVLSCKPDFPQGFSEFNFLGAFVLACEAWASRYHVIDVSKEGHPPSTKKLFQLWSHSPIDVFQAYPWGGSGIPLEKFKELGL